ncbi:hypothetical protein BKA83DRAFT_3378895 [Pisolithus microcarpus]|nr:hypothetical protein BKA83DRAFT_3378895 [Pisolithus microcarpus]
MPFSSVSFPSLPRHFVYIHINIFGPVYTSAFPLAVFTYALCSPVSALPCTIFVTILSVVWDAFTIR